jgi:peptidoglycan hydrolase-like protein with peptidoglycan-binding domain
MKKKYIAGLFIGTLALAFVVVPTSASAATCSFTRDLDLGVDGEDVRCLQKYLNANGFVIATSGVGSPGNETSLFRQLTKDAIAKWQAKNGLPATGFFGAMSRATYNKLASGVVSGGASNAPATTGSLGGLNPSEVAAFLARLNGGSNSSTSGTPMVNSSRQSEAEQRLRKAIEAVRDEDDFEEEEVRDAIEKLLGAMIMFTNHAYADASADALKAYEMLDGKDVDEDELDEDIADMRDLLEDARDDVSDAEDDDVDVDDAEDLLDEAEDLIDEAEEAFDDEDYDDARDALDEAEELIDEALDDIGVDREDEAQQAIDDAQDAIDEAEEVIDNAKDDDEDTDSAEELFDAAEERLDDAEEAFDDEDWDSAIEDAEDAEDLANDAIDELD